MIDGRSDNTMQDLSDVMWLSLRCLDSANLRMLAAASPGERGEVKTSSLAGGTDTKALLLALLAVLNMYTRIPAKQAGGSEYPMTLPMSIRIILAPLTA